MKRMAILAAAALSSLGCASVLRGGDADRDVHLHLTYFMARAAGFDASDARAIAAADCYTDEHPDTTSVGTERRVAGGLLNPITIPQIVGTGLADVTFGGETARRAFGSRAGEATAWAVTPLAHRLHFPARAIYEKTEPAFVTDTKSGDIYYNNREAVIVLEQAFRSLETHDEDVSRSLALLGIGLHTLQDSYKHAGYCAALGHIGVWPDPDDVSRDLRMAREIAQVTLQSLRYARALLGGGGTPPAWREDFERLYRRPLCSGECRQERWIAWIRRSFGDDYGTWEETRAAWRSDGGAGVFDRALDRIRDGSRKD